MSSSLLKVPIFYAYLMVRHRTLASCSRVPSLFCQTSLSWARNDLLTLHCLFTLCTSAYQTNHISFLVFTVCTNDTTRLSMMKQARYSKDHIFNRYEEWDLLNRTPATLGFQDKGIPTFSRTLPKIHLKSFFQEKERWTIFCLEIQKQMKNIQFNETA